MKIYLVGGAVRDKLLGLPIKERDYVVVGATIADMLKLGYRQVGKEFPVFLHPKTAEEYALARMERKVKPGYKGFEFETTPDVTLEDDLIRRDLTINAMAEATNGDLIDPYQGKADLDKKILRHVSPAFAEDPVRILRVGRFLARFARLGFHVAPETLKLMQNMVAYGEVDALVAERVWKELERALGEPNPEKFFEVLHECHALGILFPNLDRAGIGMKALLLATNMTQDPAIRFAALLHDWPKTAIQHLCKRYRLPNAYTELAVQTGVHYATALKVDNLSAQELMDLFSTMDIYRRQKRFEDFVTTCKAIAEARGVKFNPQRLLDSAQVARDVDVQILLAQGLQNNELAKALREKRQESVAQWLKGQ